MRTGYSDLNVLAGLGSEGRHPQHMYSDLIKKLDPPHIHRFECTLPLKLHEKNPRDHVQHMLLPHETFSKMYHMYPNQWKTRMVPTDESINMFWSQMEGHPLLVDHPMKERDNWWELAVPYSIHIDGVPCVGVGKAWGKTMELFSWCSCLVLGSSMATFLYIYGLFGVCISKRFGADTMLKFWTVLCWSMAQLFSGEWDNKDAFGVLYDPDSPEGRRAGKPLCGRGLNKFFGVPLIARGDLDMFFKTMGLQNYNSNTPCNLCPANTSNMPWKDLRRTALWLTRTWTPQTWKARNLFPQCLLFSKLKFFNIYCINGDWMHTTHLGVFQYVYGSILSVLVFDTLVGTPSDNMRKVMSDLRTFWKTHATPGHYQGITLKMFSNENDPEKKQPKLKGRAGEVKHLGKALLHVFQMHRRPGFIPHASIVLMLQKFIRMDDILDAHAPHLHPKLPTAAATEFEQCGFDACALLTQLADHYMRIEPKPLFNVTIKAHYIIHIAVTAKFLNPRLAMCYSGEDYMHHMKRLVQSSVRGTKATEVNKKMCDKVRYAMHFEFSASGR